MASAKMRPSDQLVGMKLHDGWSVASKMAKPATHTGGHFSTGYVVEHESGREGFLKAIDFADAIRSPDPVSELQRLSSTFLFERSLCQKCTGNAMDRVVQTITHGSVTLDASDPWSVVSYIIFELASGDVRKYIDKYGAVDEAWSLRCIHHIAVGISQLHSADIAHQDIKPSNVLTFAGDVSKIADLGRAASRGHTAPHDEITCAGDKRYAPPEHLYGVVEREWSNRRVAADLYLLGSMVVFLFSQATMTGLIAHFLPAEYHWTRWKGNYAEVLPYVRNAFGRALETVQTDFPASHRSSLVEAVSHLCEPDPIRRGEPMSGPVSSSKSLERFISKFDLLASRAEARLKG